MRLCNVCGEKATHIHVGYIERHTITRNGREFRQLEPFHVYWCCSHSGEHLSARLLENNGTGSRANDTPAPSARPQGGPTDGQ